MALGLCILLTACGAPQNVVDTFYDWQTNDKTAANNVVTTQPEQTKDEVKPIVKPTAGNLSDNLFDFQFQIEGTVYQVPMWYSEFVRLGWEYQGDENEKISPNSQQMLYGSFEKDGIMVYCGVYNYGINSVPVKDCMITVIYIDEGYQDVIDPSIMLAGGIALGVSTTEDIIAMYGEPSSLYEGGYSTSLYYYREGSYSDYVVLYVSVETGTLSEMNLYNFEELEGINPEALEFKGGIPEAVLNYEQPTKIGQKMEDFTIKLEGVLYQVPVPMEQLLLEGWKLKDGDPNELIIPGKNTEYLYMEKDGMEICVCVYNCSDDAVYAKYSIISIISTESYRDKVASIEVTKEIKTGMSKADLENILSDYEYTITEYSFYTEYVLKIDDNYYKKYRFHVDEEQVKSIEVEYREE